MNKTELFGYSFRMPRKREILEQIIKYIGSREPYYHIVSLNPENAVLANQNREFKEVVVTARAVIADGVGIVLAVQMIKGIKPDHITGVDFMDELVNLADNMSCTVLFIGGKGNLAKEVAECYSQNYARATFIGIEGFENIKNPSKNEEKLLFDIVAARRPRFIFAAFGSPEQELWFFRNRHKFEGIVCMGVGGAFDFKTGLVPRAPRLIRFIGFEWLYRLILQPWRLKRQSRLLTFVGMVLSSLRQARTGSSVERTTAS